jgi:hypothetical protein
MFYHPYVLEKLMELEKSRANHIPPHPLASRTPRANAFARTVGRAMRRAGEGLEVWAAPRGGSPDHSCPDARRY